MVQFLRKEGCDAKLRLDIDRKPYVTDYIIYVVCLYFKTRIKDAWGAGKDILSFEGVLEHRFFRI